jgi:hypothetical protein
LASATGLSRLPPSKSLMEMARSERFELPALRFVV